MGVNLLDLDGASSRPSQGSNLSGGRIFPLYYDAVFKDVMCDTETLRPVVEALLHRRVDEMSIDRQVEIADGSADSDPVRLDVFCRCGNDLINIEIQVAKTKNLLRRARFYSSAIDVKKQKTDHGRDYALSNSHVVFFCSKAAIRSLGLDSDPLLVKGKTRYEAVFPPEYNPAPVTELDDGRSVLFINYQSDMIGAFPEVLRDLCAVLAGDSEAKTPYKKLLLERVQRANGKKEVVNMAINEQRIYEDARFEGYEEGKAEGHTEGYNEGYDEGKEMGKTLGREEGEEMAYRKVARNVYLSCGKDVDKTAAFLGLTVERVKRLIEIQLP